MNLDSNIVTIIVAGFSFVISAAGLITQLRRDRQAAIVAASEVESDSTKVITDTSLSLILPLQARIKEMEQEGAGWREKYAELEQQLNQISDSFAGQLAVLDRGRRTAELEIEDLRRENTELRKMIERLEAQVISLDETPITRRSRTVE